MTICRIYAQHNELNYSQGGIIWVDDNVTNWALNIKLKNISKMNVFFYVKSINKNEKSLMHIIMIYMNHTMPKVMIVDLAPYTNKIFSCLRLQNTFWSIVMGHFIIRRLEKYDSEMTRRQVNHQFCVSRLQSVQTNNCKRVICFVLALGMTDVICCIVW